MNCLCCHGTCSHYGEEDLCSQVDVVVQDLRIMWSSKSRDSVNKLKRSESCGQVCLHHLLSIFSNSVQA